MVPVHHGSNVALALLGSLVTSAAAATAATLGKKKPHIKSTYKTGDHYYNQECILQSWDQNKIVFSKADGPPKIVQTSVTR